MIAHFFTGFSLFVFFFQYFNFTGSKSSRIGVFLFHFRKLHGHSSIADFHNDSFPIERRNNQGPFAQGNKAGIAPVGFLSPVGNDFFFLLRFCRLRNLIGSFLSLVRFCFFSFFTSGKALFSSLDGRPRGYMTCSPVAS